MVLAPIGGRPTTTRAGRLGRRQRAADRHAFAGGVALVGGLWGWSGANWGGGDITIDADRVNNINRNVSRDRATVGSGNRWQHDARHRQGVAYRGDEVRNRYQGDRQRQAASREQFRGRTQQPAELRRTDGSRRRRPGGGDRAGGGTGQGGRRGSPGAASGPAGIVPPAAGRRSSRHGPAARRGSRRSPRPGGGGRNARRAGGGDRLSASGRPQVSQRPAPALGGTLGQASWGSAMAAERAASQRGAASGSRQPAAVSRAAARAPPAAAGVRRLRAGRWR